MARETQKPKSAKTMIGCFLGGCVVPLVLALLLAGGCIGLFFYGGKKFEPHVDKYLTAVNEERFGDVYAETHPEFKEQQTEEAFLDFIQRIKRVLGDSQSKKLHHISVNKSTAGSLAALRYEMTFEQGVGMLSITLKEEKGIWRVLGVHYESELLLPLLKCPGCGKTNKAIHPHCAQCGEFIPLPKKAEADAEAE